MVFGLSVILLTKKRKILDCSYYLDLLLFIWVGGWGVLGIQPAVSRMLSKPSAAERQTQLHYMSMTEGNELHNSHQSLCVPSGFRVQSWGKELDARMLHPIVILAEDRDDLSHPTAGGTLPNAGMITKCSDSSLFNTKHREKFSVHCKLPCVCSHLEVTFHRQI